ncbi:unnamed protein product [Agarophyton chilense]
MSPQIVSKCNSSFIDIDCITHGNRRQSDKDKEQTSDFRQEFGDMIVTGNRITEVEEVGDTVTEEIDVGGVNGDVAAILEHEYVSNSCANMETVDSSKACASSSQLSPESSTPLKRPNTRKIQQNIRLKASETEGGVKEEEGNEDIGRNDTPIKLIDCFMFFDD